MGGQEIRLAGSLKGRLQPGMTALRFQVVVTGEVLLRVVALGGLDGEILFSSGEGDLAKAGSGG